MRTPRSTDQFQKISNLNCTFFFTPSAHRAQAARGQQTPGCESIYEGIISKFGSFVIVWIRSRLSSSTLAGQDIKLCCGNWSFQVWFVRDRLDHITSVVFYSSRARYQTLLWLVISKRALARGVRDDVLV